MMKKPLMVLAGGYGKRLRSVVSDVPKPLAPVCGRPFIFYLIQNWVDQGIEDFIFLLHYEAQQIENLLFELKESSSFSNVEFRTVLENKPLGTGGAILNAIDQLKLVESFLVANADTWLSSGVEIISKKSRPTIAAVKTKNTSRYGLLNYEKIKLPPF